MLSGQGSIRQNDLLAVFDNWAKKFEVIFKIYSLCLLIYILATFSIIHKR